MSDPYEFDIDLSGKTKRASKSSAKKSIPKKKRHAKTKQQTSPKNNGLGVMERAQYFLSKYNNNNASTTLGKSGANRKKDAQFYDEEGEDEDSLYSSDASLDPDYVMGTSRASSTPKNRGMIRSNRTSDLHDINTVNYGQHVDDEYDDGLSETKDSTTSSLVDLHGAPAIGSKYDSEDDGDSFSSASRKSPRSPKHASPRSPRSPSSLRRPLHQLDFRSNGSLVDEESKTFDEEEEEEDDQVAYERAMLQLQQEDEARKREALAMMNQLHENEDQNDDNEEEGDDDDDYDYEQALKQLEQEEERRRKEALEMLQQAQQTTTNEKQGRISPQRNSPTLRVEISNSNYKTEKIRIKDEDSYYSPNASGTDGGVEEEYYAESVEPMSAYSLKSIKSAVSGKSLRSAKSVRSSKSLKSVRSTKSPRSVKSVRSTRSNRSSKSIRSKISHARSYVTNDDYSMDDFESEMELMSPKSILSPPNSPRSPHSVHFAASPSKYSAWKKHSKPIGHVSKPKMVDSSTQHIEQRDIEIQANLVVSASGMVYEVGSTPVGAVEPTLFPPSSMHSNTATTSSNNNYPPVHACPTCHHHANYQYNFMAQQPHPGCAQYAWGALNNPLNKTYTQTYAQARQGHEQPKQEPPAASANERYNGLTASLLATQNMFKRNLEMIRSHLNDCRLSTDREIMSNLNNQHHYSSYADVSKYISENKPKVRSLDEAMAQVMKENIH